VAIGQGAVIKDSQITNALIMEGVEIQGARLKDSILGLQAKVISHGGPTPSRLLVGDNSVVEI